ncbi:PLP-dependent aminotransferase family protein [Streptomyces sp. DSM 44915]|uniref:PLP-dependent aminotransferase family protein n=1 Tax=Streptomyces chisholmiae TaxID=3075540 RepID=A0ABU2JWE2_9ACTN|nr:PLP-dependent aminotransferase family protein [Streptomyces sp. DSM 44915]MDT0268849.1 PLP-dependent aminotransferase family protein [Streptomyces sp. DSM 44915]
MAPDRLQPLTRAVLTAVEERLDHGTARGLAHAVRHAVRDGVLRPGTRLPPIRQVATELALSPTTVSAAWSLLGAAGTIRTNGRGGTVVTAGSEPGPVRYRRALAGPAAPRLDLSTGVPDPRLLPDLSRALARARAGGGLGYLHEPVLPELRAALRADWPCPHDEIMVTDGAMDALDQVVRVLLRPGDRVVVEDPCFPPLADLLEAAGARLVGVPLDPAGLCPTALADALRAPTAALFLQPRAQNPTGISMTERRATELTRLVGASGALVVEDDAAGAVATAPALSLARWLPERTVHIRSFAKSHGPDLRLAAMSAPAALTRDLLARRQLGQGWSSRLLQGILADLLTDPVAIAEVAAARAVYARRRGALLAALRAAGVPLAAGETDGVNLWLPVRDEAEALARLAAEGVVAAAGAPFHLRPDATPHLRITTGALDHPAAVAPLLATAAA